MVHILGYIDYWKIGVSVLIILPVVLSSASIVFSNMEVAVYHDDLTSFAQWADVGNMSAWINGTHLLVSFKFADSIPEIHSANTFLRQVYVYIDADFNVSTGAGGGSYASIMYGGDYSVYAKVQGGSGGFTRYLTIYTYAKDGSTLNRELKSEWLDFDNYTLTVGIPLTYLNITPDLPVRIFGSMTLNEYKDVVEMVVRQQLPAVHNISLDGNSSDWEGVEPLFRDTDEGNDPEEFTPYNITTMYVGVDGDFMYFGVKFAAPLSVSDMKSGNLNQAARLFLDVNNDGAYDYELTFMRWSSYATVHIYNFTSHKGINNNIYDPKSSGSEGDFIEYRINATSLNLPIETDFRLRLLSANSYSFDILGINAGRVRLYLNTGEGAYVAKPYGGQYLGALLSGREYNLVHLYINTTFINTSQGKLVYGMYLNEPTAKGTIEAPHDNTSLYYCIKIWPKEDIQWPINIKFLANGLANPTLLYLNGTTGIYMPLKEQVYSPTDDAVYANISQSEYFANEELVIVLIGQEPTTTTTPPATTVPPQTTTTSATTAPPTTTTTTTTLPPETTTTITSTTATPMTSTTQSTTTTTTTSTPTTVPTEPGELPGINYGVIAGIVAAIIIVAVLLFIMMRRKR